MTTDGEGIGAGEVTDLGPDMSGRWEVTTRTSRHIWDLDLRTYGRHPLHPASRSMPYDGMDLPITAVHAWPRLGHHSFVLFDDPAKPAVEHWRRSGTILRIVRLTTEEGWSVG